MSINTTSLNNWNDASRAFLAWNIVIPDAIVENTNPPVKVLGDGQIIVEGFNNDPTATVNTEQVALQVIVNLAPNSVGAGFVDAADFIADFKVAQSADLNGRSTFAIKYAPGFATNELALISYLSFLPPLPSKG